MQFRDMVRRIAMVLPPVQRRYAFLRELGRQRDELGATIAQIDAERAALAARIEAQNAEAEGFRISALSAERRAQHLANLLKDAESTRQAAFELPEAYVRERAELEAELLAAGEELEAVLQQAFDVELRSHNYSHALAASEAEKNAILAQLSEARTLAEQQVREIHDQAGRHQAAIDAQATAHNEAFRDLLAQHNDMVQSLTGQRDEAVRAFENLQDAELKRARDTLAERDAELAALKRAEQLADGRMADLEAATLQQEHTIKALRALADSHAAALAQAHAQLEAAGVALPPPRDQVEVEAAFARLQKKDAVLRKAFDGLLLAMKPEIICDIGAFNGDESAHFRKLCPEADIYLFEASKRNFEGLIRPRDDLDGVTLENFALSDVDGSARFHELVVPENNPGAAWMRGAGSLRERIDEYGTTPVDVKTVRLDTYFAEQIKAGKRFVLWVDVEGALDMVLGGADEVLRTTLALRVEVEHKEYWAEEPLVNEIIEHMKSKNFSVFGDTFTPGSINQSDLLLINDNWLNIAHP
jgi:FkbM family methyltransferase